jgi:malate synthase
MDIFDRNMPTPNQIHVKREDLHVSAADLLTPPQGSITEAGLRLNINVGILYIESWLKGVGAAALYNLMEDAATAEISRTQVWQWIQRRSRLDDGRTVTYDMVSKMIPEELDKIREYMGQERYERGRFAKASELFDQLVRSRDFAEFLTLPAYELL